MAIAHVRNHTAGTHTTTGTAISTTLAANVTAGNLLVALFVFDNTATSTPTVSSITKQAGETASWTRIGQVDSTSSSPGNGVRGEVWAILTTVTWSTAPTATLDAAVVARIGLLSEFSGASTTLRGGTWADGTSTTGSPTAATNGLSAQPTAGDLVIGAGAFEGATAPTGDADTTGGSWSTAYTASAEVGANTSNAAAILQHKIVSSGSAAQNYGPTQSPGGGDSGAIITSLQPAASGSAFIGWGIPL